VEQPGSGARVSPQVGGDAQRVPSRRETIRHFWGSELLYAPTDPGQDPRHVGTIEPNWNLFDFTPEGRDEHFDEQLNYDCH
jgi:predicted dithiol-disulfide oxidoreductase (DUF899 family)